MYCRNESNWYRTDVYIPTKQDEHGISVGKTVNCQTQWYLNISNMCCMTKALPYKAVCQWKGRFLCHIYNMYNNLTFDCMLIHWGRVTHICVSKLTIFGSDNGMSPDRRQAVIWTNAGILLIEPLRTKFSEIFIEIYTFSFGKMHLKMSSWKWRPFCLGLNELKWSIKAMLNSPYRVPENILWTL